MPESESDTAQDWIHLFWDCLSVPASSSIRLHAAVALRDKYKPDSLFRFRPLNLEREFENVLSQQVWLSPPRDANDPYDSSFSFSYQQFNMPDAVRKTVRDGLLKLFGTKLDPSELAEIARFPDITDERCKALFQKGGPPGMPSATVQLTLSVARQTLDQMRMESVDDINRRAKENLRICCFSETRDEVLMWAHYADQNRGCCVEFDVRDLFIPGQVGILLPIMYDDRLFDVTPYYQDILKGDGNKLVALIAACRKSKRWSYEREWRIVCPAPPPQRNAKLRIPIKSLTMGLRTSSDDQRRLTEIAHRLQIPLFKTLMSPSSTTLVFQPA
jgi:hypothetical protein